MLRYVKAFFLAVLVTGGLFITMQALIATGDTELSDAPTGKVSDFIRPPEPEEVQQDEELPEPPPAVEEPPPEMEPPSPDVSDVTDTGDSGSSFSYDIDLGGGVGGPVLNPGDGELLPITAVAPVYPRRAQSRGIEGTVLVELTVTELGTVENPRVIEANPPGIFNGAALAAARKFKYRPRTEDGKPVKVDGVKYLFTFKL